MTETPLRSAFFVFLLLLMLIFCSASTVAASGGQVDSLLISGRVMIADKPVADVTVTVFKDNNAVDTLLTSTGGKFAVLLGLNENYALVFDTPDGYHRILLINTAVPSHTENIKPFRMAIRPDAKYITDTQAPPKYSDIPIGLVKFDTISGRFELDYHYNLSRIREIK